MLLERYLAKTVRTLPEPLQPALGNVANVRRILGLRRIICTGTSVFEERAAVVPQYFALQDQTVESRQLVLQIAGSLASRQADRSLQALAQAAREAGLPLREPDLEHVEPTLLARLDRTWYLLGGLAEMEAEGVELGVTSRTMAAKMESDGCRVVLLAQKQPKRLLAIFAVRDPLLSDATATVQRLRELNIELVLLTGEKNRIAGGVAESLGIDLVRSELSDKEKEHVLFSLVESAPDAAVLCDPGAFLKTPESAFVVLIDHKRVPSADVVLPSLSLVPDLIEAARELAVGVHRHYFWLSI